MLKGIAQVWPDHSIYGFRASVCGKWNAPPEALSLVSGAKDPMSWVCFKSLSTQWQSCRPEAGIDVCKQKQVPGAGSQNSDRTAGSL